MLILETKDGSLRPRKFLAEDGSDPRIKTALFAYCRLDTLAMVKIIEKLDEK